jgi:hypothetical protein
MWSYLPASTGLVMGWACEWMESAMPGPPHHPGRSCLTGEDGP